MERKRSQRGEVMFNLFGKWDTNVDINDLSLKQVISFDGRKVPHTHGRHAKKKFAKTKVNVVERLVNKLMRGGTGDKVGGRVIRTHGRLQGKKLRVIKFVEEAFDIINKKTGKNPVEVFVRALENTAPREDVTRVQMGGVSYQLSVDDSATRRLDVALRNISLAALMRSFNQTKSLPEALAEEIIYASQNDIQNSYAVKRKDEIERMAKAAR